MYIFLTMISHALSLLPKSILDQGARFLSFICFDILRIRRRVILGNLAIALSPDLNARQRKQIGRRSIYHFWLTILETLISVRRGIAAGVEVRGRDQLDQALARGQGAYILCFHLGNWEAMGAKMSQSFCPSHILVKKIKSPGLSKWLAKTRLGYGFFTIQKEKKGDGFRGIQEVLKRGEIVGFAFDQTRPSAPRLPFFNKPAKTNTSLAAIWRKQPAPIIPAYIVRKSFGQHVLYIEPEILLEKTGEEAADIDRHSVAFNQAVESIIRKHPEQYFWLHNRWK